MGGGSLRAIRYPSHFEGRSSARFFTAVQRRSVGTSLCDKMCEDSHMATNLTIDSKTIAGAMPDGSGSLRMKVRR